MELMALNGDGFEGAVSGGAAFMPNTTRERVVVTPRARMFTAAPTTTWSARTVMTKKANRKEMSAPQRPPTKAPSQAFWV